MELCRFKGEDDVEYKKVAAALIRIASATSSKKIGPSSIDHTARKMKRPTLSSFTSSSTSVAKLWKEQLWECIIHCCISS
jgi:hypothetical protein